MGDCLSPIISTYPTRSNRLQSWSPGWYQIPSPCWTPALCLHYGSTCPMEQHPVRKPDDPALTLLTFQVLNTQRFPRHLGQDVRRALLLMWFYAWDVCISWVSWVIARSCYFNPCTQPTVTIVRWVAILHY